MGCRFMRLAALCVALCAFSATAAGEADAPARPALTAVLPVTGGAVEVRATEIDGENWLFLPAFAPLEGLRLTLDGSEVSWEAAGETEDGDACMEVNAEEPLSVTVMRSENLRSLFLFSDDPEEHGRAYVEDCDHHEHFASASMALISPSGRVDHAGAIRKLRGRGNGTWGGANTKNPYQFKLEERADLLDTGLPAEQERTWLLLADMSDGTLLHNRVTLDMGLELGLPETSHSEHIDLYYDGEYRGTYLLCEKTEIGRGRVDETDYEKLLEGWNSRVDLEALPVGTGRNAFGNEYHYIENVAVPEQTDAGAYLLEMEMESTTLSDRCWFRLSDGSVIASKNPQNPAQGMIDYISTRLQEARDTLENGGVNPQNGRTLEDDFDVDAFARTMLVQELSYNYDGYRYSSSFFVLPAGEKRFRPGPLWDFDLAYRYMANGLTAGGAGFKETGGWMHAFYQCPAFVRAARDIYRDELYPMVREILLGDRNGAYLKSLDEYEAEIGASRRMNNRLWTRTNLNRYVYGRDTEGEMALLRQFLDERSDWLLSALTEEEADVVLWTSAVYGHVDESVRVMERPWNSAAVTSVRWEKRSEATAEDYAVWQLELLLSPRGAEPVDEVLLNGTRIPCERQEDGTLRALVTFEDPSYRPVDYYGEDIGMIYNYDVYIQNYPEVAEECGYDPEAVMDAFCDDGMYEDQMGNAFFRPSEVLAAYPEMIDVLGEDWQLYYWEFLAYGYRTDKWLMRMGRAFFPEVCSAL